MHLFKGSSQSLDPRAAARQAVRAALKGAEAPAAAVVFCTEQYGARQLAEAVGAELGAVPWAGCSTGGVIDGGRVLRQGVVVGLLSSSRLRVGIGVGRNVGADPRSAGATAAREALRPLPAAAPRGHRVLFVFTDAQAGNAAEVVRGASQFAGADVLWAGGGAGDHLHSLAQLANGEAFTDAVVIVAIDGERRFGAGVAHGWRPYGPPALVTRAEGRVVHELEYDSAFEV
ncbi:MAG: FIST signal transduction protein, partial [Myxococcales bacterium]